VEAALKTIRSYFFLALLSLPVIALDQYTKWIIRENFVIGETWMPWNWLAPYARIVYWHNTGVAFGLFQNAGLIVGILSALVALAIVIYFPRVPTSDWTLRVAMGLQLAGAVGNLIDRVTIGYVTDFISVGTFPVFNVADSSITIGTTVLILGVWLQERQEKRKQREKEEVDKTVKDHPSENFEIQ
jgi:signal peptidase II